MKETGNSTYNPMIDSPKEGQLCKFDVSLMEMKNG